MRKYSKFQRGFISGLDLDKNHMTISDIAMIVIAGATTLNSAILIYILYKLVAE